MSTLPEKQIEPMGEHIEHDTRRISQHGQTGHVEGNALLVNKQGEIRKIPVPSSDPNDPLNFRPWEKYAVVFVACWFSIMGLSLASGLGSILDVFFAMYLPRGYSSDDILLLITLPTLCIGLGNLILLPLGLAFGRRPVFLTSMAVLLAASIWAATQNSYEQHLAARIIQGIVTGSSESLLPLMLTEVTFLHERARVFGLYWMVQNAVSSALNLSSSYLNETLGWRWYYWVFVITVAVGLVVAVFAAFETQFDRPAVSLDGQLIFTDESGTTRVIPDSDAQEYLSKMDTEAAFTQQDQDSANSRATYPQRLRLWSKPRRSPARIIWMSWLQMAQSISSPGILYAVLASSITLGCTVGMSLTYNTVLTQNFGWRPKDVGLINVGGVIGSILGMLYCSLAGQWIILQLAAKNRGVHTPEHNLVNLIAPAIVGFGMVLLYGLTASGGGSWWGPYLGWTILQFSFTAILIITTTFASEAAVKNPGPALVVVVGSKNIVSFGTTYGLNPMVESYSYKWAFGVLAGIFGGIFLLGIPVYWLNPRWRAYVGRKRVQTT